MKNKLGIGVTSALAGKPEIHSAYGCVRPREYLTDAEVERLMKAAAKTGRHGHRNSTLILVTYRHDFRVSELTGLRWDQVELDSGSLHISRVKKGTPSVHPIRGPEIRALRTNLPLVLHLAPQAAWTAVEIPLPAKPVRRPLRSDGWRS